MALLANGNLPIVNLTASWLYWPMVIYQLQASQPPGFTD